MEVINNPPLEKIALEPGIYDLTGEIREYIENNTPMSDETVNVLRTFDREYSFEEDIRSRGKGEVLSELDDALEYFDFKEAKLAAQEGMALAQIINPDVPIKPYPIVFLFIPFRGDAKSLYGQGCGINIRYLKATRHGEDSVRQKIVTFTAHETVHVFLGQLGVKPESQNRNWKKAALDFMWEEGLATHVEPTHYLPHDVVKSDGAYWVDLVNRWFDSDSVGKEELFKEILERPSFQYWYNYMYNNQPLPYDWDPNDTSFMTLLRRRNGLGYHIGAYLWEKQIQEGHSLKDLVMKGSDQMNKWMKEV